MKHYKSYKHNFNWACKQLDKGKKVRRSIWYNDHYIFAIPCGGGIPYEKNFYRGKRIAHNCPYNRVPLLLEDIQEKDWELYQEPKE